MSHPSPVSVGIIANPSSGRDMRRLIAWAPVFATAEKINLVLRLLAAMGRLGVEEAWMLPDATGIARQVRETADLARTNRGLPMPQVRLLDMRIQDNAQDSADAAARMREVGVRAIAVLGGDGTHRAVARQCGPVPLATLSSGTNNAFPELREATLVGMATALVATGRVSEHASLRANKRLRVCGRGVDEIALVDVCLSRQDATGAGAVWRGDDVCEIFASFAEPKAVGLSSIAGLTLPTSRAAAHGVHVRMGPGRILYAPLLPGGVEEVSIASVQRLRPGRAVRFPAQAGTVAFDGERLIEFGADNDLTVELDFDGPRTIAVEATLEHAALNGGLFKAMPALSAAHEPLAAAGHPAAA